MIKFRSKLIVAVIIILGVTAFMSCQKEKDVFDTKKLFKLKSNGN